MSIVSILILALVQGLAELLPVSSSAHVIVAEKFMGLDPSSPEMTLLLVMLHTGTMFAVIVYFWKAWKKSLFASLAAFQQRVIPLFTATMFTGTPLRYCLYGILAVPLLTATACTAAVGYPLKWAIEWGLAKSGTLVRDSSGHLPKAEIELLFNNLGLIAAALFAAGVLILIAGLIERRKTPKGEIGVKEAACIGAVQGLCVPLRGFSRSGATISAGMLLGSAKSKVEEFSFALAVIITPGAVWHMVSRFLEAKRDAGNFHLTLGLFVPSLIGMVAAFFAGLLALRWLSGWLEHGRWYLFGIYCLLASAFVFGMHLSGC